MRKIEENVLDFLDNESNETNEDDNFIKLIDNFNLLKIYKNKHIFKSFLHFLTHISNEHHRSPFLFNRIEQILKYFEKDIKKYFSNSEIFNIFKRSKKILLSLLEEKIITMDEHNVKQILREKYIKYKYPQYFLPEIRPFINEKWFQNLTKKNGTEFELEINELIKNFPVYFNEKRKTGENDSYICELIRNDSVEKFIAYINKNSISLSTKIQTSIYETNYFFLKNENPSLIEYSAFYGSIQIFKYLLFNKLTMSQKSLICAIHSRNPEMVHLHEENDKIDEKSCKMYLKESIKCHHNDFWEYFRTQYFEDDASINGIKYYSFSKIQNIDKSSFYYLCKYDYYILVNILLKRKNVDINKKIIL